MSGNFAFAEWMSISFVPLSSVVSSRSRDDLDVTGVSISGLVTRPRVMRSGAASLHLSLSLVPLTYAITSSFVSLNVTMLHTRFLTRITFSHPHLLFTSHLTCCAHGVACRPDVGCLATSTNQKPRALAVCTHLSTMCYRPHAHSVCADQSSQFWNLHPD